MTDPVLWWILAAGLAMSSIALVGSATLLLPEATLDRIILPLVALSAGSLLGGAFFHLIPATLDQRTPEATAAWVLAGFVVFFGIEQFLHWHHCHRASAACKQPLTYLVLLGDGLHNFLGGLAVAGTFLIDIRLGIAAWLAAAAHEVPQELGDFAVLIHGGWSKSRALALNFVSALTFPLGGIVAYTASFHVDVDVLVPFAAGNFLYIGASDLVPEVNKHHGPVANLINFASLVTGIALLYAIRMWLD